MDPLLPRIIRSSSEGLCERRGRLDADTYLMGRGNMMTKADVQKKLVIGCKLAGCSTVQPSLDPRRFASNRDPIRGHDKASDTRSAPYVSEAPAYNCP
jgi:hypothetical protein